MMLRSTALSGFGAGVAEVPCDTTSSSSGEWNGATGSFTFSGDGVDCNAGDKAIRTNDTFTGDFTLTYTQTTGIYMVIGVYDIAEDGTFVSTGQGHGGMGSMVRSWYWEYNANGQTVYGGENQSAETIADGSVMRLERRSGVVKLYDDDAEIYEWLQTDTPAVEVRIVTGAHTGHPDLDSVSWKPC